MATSVRRRRSKPASSSPSASAKIAPTCAAGLVSGEARGDHQRGGDDLARVGGLEPRRVGDVVGERVDEVDRGGAERAHGLGGDVVLEHRGLLAQQVAEQRPRRERPGQGGGASGRRERVAASRHASHSRSSSVRKISSRDSK